MSVEQITALIGSAAGILDRFTGEAWIKDHRHRFRYINGPFAIAVNCPPTDALCCQASDLFPRNIAAQYVWSDREAMRNGKLLTIEEPGVRHPETRYQTLKIPVYAPSGAAIGSIGLASELTSLLAAARISRLLGATGSGQAGWLHETLRQLHEDPAASQALLAQAAGVHRNTLGRRFEQCFGVSLTDYRLWRRACAARYKIITGMPSSLADIATACGYADQSHLNLDFRRFFGITPGEFRQLALWAGHSAQA